MRDFKRKRAVSTFRGNLPALLLFSVLMVVIVVLFVSSFLALSAQAETTTERLEREIEESRARLKADCDNLPKEYRIKREEYGTLTEDERIDRQKALNKEQSRNLSELKVKDEMIRALSKEIFRIVNEATETSAGYESMSQSELEDLIRSHDALLEKAQALDREADRLTAEMAHSLEKAKRMEAEWCFLEFVMGK